MKQSKNLIEKKEDLKKMIEPWFEDIEDESPELNEWILSLSSKDFESIYYPLCDVVDGFNTNHKSLKDIQKLIGEETGSYPSLDWIYQDLDQSIEMVMKKKFRNEGFHGEFQIQPHP